jgi:hypothetical protein
MKLTDRQKKIADQYKMVFGDENGRAVLGDLLGQYVLNTRFDTDPYVNAYVAGKRDLVMAIATLVYEDEHKILQRIAEITEG